MDIYLPSLEAKCFHCCSCKSMNYHIMTIVFLATLFGFSLQFVLEIGQCFEGGKHFRAGLLFWTLSLSDCTIVFFKLLGNRHIHKEIKLQESVDAIDNILCKTDLNLIGTLIYKCNTFNNVHFEACFKSAYVPLWYSQFQVFRKGWFPIMYWPRFKLTPYLNWIHHVT